MAKLSNSGRMKDRVGFYEIERKSGEWGVIENPILIGEFYCELRSQYLHEVQKNIGTLLENTLTIILRYHEALNVTNEMYAVINGVTYEVIQHTKDVSLKQFDTVLVRRRD